jgi:repressor LexA
MTEQLTDRQRSILEFIQHEITRHSRPPTAREIMREFGYASPRAATFNILALERKGYLRRIPGQSRNLQLVVPAGGVPIVGDVAAGQPIPAVENITGRLELGDAFGPGDLFAVRVKGESMQGCGILDGDYVVVRRQPEVTDGAIVVAYIEGEATVKRFQRTRTGYRLQPENDAFRPIEVKRPQPGEEAGTDFRIAGPVVGVVRTIKT